MQIDIQYFWQVVLFLSLGTLCIRGSIIIFSSRIKISERAREILTFIPAAILPGIITPLVFFHNGSVKFLLGKERMIILMLASIISYLTKSMLATIGFGLALLYILTQF